MRQNRREGFTDKCVSKNAGRVCYRNLVLLITALLNSGAEPIHEKLKLGCNYLFTFEKS